jgi:hypothetical protein
MIHIQPIYDEGMEMSTYNEGHINDLICITNLLSKLDVLAGRRNILIEALTHYKGIRLMIVRSIWKDGTKAVHADVMIRSYDGAMVSFRV